ncbi:MAG: hypothetical protein LBJ72_10140 [Dysgonamonadaceae bacterium]|jgi:transposase-like protein|nr:hypothetical protein [Dysgonamonadaceae bacterium]
MRRKAIVSNEQKERIIALYNNNIPLKEIKHREGIHSDMTIYRILDEFGVSRKRKNLELSIECKKKIITLYNDNIPFKEIIRQTGIKSYRIIYKILHEFRIHRKSKKLQLSNEDKARIVALYTEGVQIKEIMQREGILSDPTIYSILDEFKILRRNKKKRKPKRVARKRITIGEKKQVISLYENYINIKNIMRCTNIASEQTIYRILDEFEIPRRKKLGDISKMSVLMEPDVLLILEQQQDASIYINKAIRYFYNQEKNMETK